MRLEKITTEKTAPNKPRIFKEDGQYKVLDVNSVERKVFEAVSNTHLTLPTSDLL